jgi:hypothetical protein
MPFPFLNEPLRQIEWVMVIKSKIKTPKEGPASHYISLGAITKRTVLLALIQGIKHNHLRARG